MFTRDSLLELAVQQDEIVKSTATPPGIRCSDEHLAARRQRDKALAAASWMEQEGVSQLAHVGEFLSFQLHKDQQVRLRRGARIHSTNPQVSREGKINTLNRQIRVFDVHSGFIATNGYSALHGGPLRNAEVHWVGTGGYWYWTDINNVEVKQ